MNEDTQEVRLDKWLWAARFFKTRSMATDAISGGKVHLNGQRVKPSRKVVVGDELTITRGLDELEVTVTALAERRGPAKVARTLYVESEESLKRREEFALQRKLIHNSGIPEHRPNKRDRRELRKLKGT